MAAKTSIFLFCFSTLLLLSSTTASLNAVDRAFQTYIVQLHPQGRTRTSSFYASRLKWHLSFLEQVLSTEEIPSSRLLYSYGSSMEGFAALLSDDEVATLRKLDDIIAIRPDRKLDLHTTYSYQFLGLGSSSSTGGAWSKYGFGKGTIIGVLDTGVWPESPSFDDRAMPEVPRRWKGVCQEGQNFKASSCNKKLIGARFFLKGHRVASSEIPRVYVSPRDSSGHGTHTSSTAGGSPVQMASVLGNGAGEARGMAPGAHIAAYKVCWFSGCYNSDILAAMDAAIKDGVDVLSLSLGGFPIPLYDDDIAIGSFRAMEKGISVICAAGNNGPMPNSVANEAPWITTVGASTLDRRFPAFVRTGNGKFLQGESMYPGKLHPERKLELVYISGGNTGSELCIEGSLPRSSVKGKIVVCDRGVNGRAEKGEVVKRAGGAAMILANTQFNLEEDSVDAHVLPATLIGYEEAVQLKRYINSTRRPTARISFLGTVIGRSRAPAVARFSSRGPSLTNPSIIKPDVIAPGVNIIAAWPQNLGPTGLPEDSRKVNFTVMSGTSMSCPHVSGIAALIHSAHPNWSPAAIKSALMTTADTTDHLGKPILDGSKRADFFAMGSGQVNPGNAMNPGLIYDIRPDDYIAHLCTLGYTKSQIFTITHRNVSCSQILRKNKGFSLNYPSVSVIFRPGLTRTVITRRLTNVGSPNSVYTVDVKAPKGVKVIVKPRKLVFGRINQTLTYRIYLLSRIRTAAKPLNFSQGYLTWVHSHQSSNVVKSPISVTWVSDKRG